VKDLDLSIHERSLHPERSEGSLTSQYTRGHFILDETKDSVKK
jgi:hypothetical protein